MRKIKEIYKYVMSRYNGAPVIAILVLIMFMSVTGNIKDKAEKENENVNSDFQQYQDFGFTNEEDDTLSIYGIKEIKIKEGSTEAELNYVNPEQNADKYFIKISITLKENNENIYSSELIPPGMGLSEVNISRTFSKGVYPAIFHIQGYKMNDMSSAKGADFDIEIKVE